MKDGYITDIKSHLHPDFENLALRSRIRLEFRLSSTVPACTCGSNYVGMEYVNHANTQMYPITLEAMGFLSYPLWKRIAMTSSSNGIPTA